MRRFRTNKGIGAARPVRAGAVATKDVCQRPLLRGADTVRATMTPIDFGRYHGRGVYRTILHGDRLTSNGPYHVVHCGGNQVCNDGDSRLQRTSEVQPKLMLMGHPVLSCHVQVVRSFFIMF